METSETTPNEEPEALSAIEMLSRIKRFWVNGKICPVELDKAAENIARRAVEDPTMLHGTSFQELTGE